MSYAKTKTRKPPTKADAQAIAKLVDDFRATYTTTQAAIEDADRYVKQLNDQIRALIKSYNSDLEALQSKFRECDIRSSTYTHDFYDVDSFDSIDTDTLPSFEHALVELQKKCPP